MKRWPDFDLNGDLPVSVHEATLSEVIQHFGSGTLQRQLVARRLQRIYNIAVGTGHLARFIVFGSFITNKSAPNDVDIFMLMEDTFDLRQVSGETAIIFHNRAAQNWEGASIFWIRRMAAIGGEEEALTDWQIRRDGSRPGMLRWLLMIRNDEELKATLDRIRHFHQQVEKLRQVETSPENYRMSAGGYLEEIDRMSLEVREFLSLLPAEVNHAVYKD